FGLLFLICVASFAAVVVFLANNPRDARKRALAQARIELSGLAETIAGEFPDEVKAWGGRGVLEEPAAVKAILRDLGEPDTAASVVDAAHAVGAPPSVRGRLFASMLSSLADALRLVERREKVPYIRIFVVAQIVGWAVGWGVAALAFLNNHPYTTIFTEFDPHILNIGVGSGFAAF